VSAADVSVLKGRAVKPIIDALAMYRAAKGDPPSGSHYLFAAQLKQLRAAAAAHNKKAKGLAEQVDAAALTFHGIPLREYREE